MSGFSVFRSALECSAAWAILPAVLGAPTTDNTENVSPQPAAPASDKRIFEVLPNYRMADGPAPFVPITTRHKFHIAAKDSFDYPVYDGGDFFQACCAKTRAIFGLGRAVAAPGAERAMRSRNSGLTSSAS